MRFLLNFLIFVFVCILLLNKIFLDTQTNTYRNKEEVINNNAIKQGWIPSIIPDSAYNIKEEHNLDTNIFKGSFKYDEKDENNFLKKLTKLNEELTWEYFIFIIDIKKIKLSLVT